MRAFLASGLLLLAGSAAGQTARSLEEALALRAAGRPVLRLDLSHTRLTEVPAAVGSFTELRELILDRNRLSSLPDTLAALVHLEILHADRNRFSVWPEVVLQLTTLRELHLGDNALDRIPEGIDRLSVLEVLAVWDNPLEIWPASLGRLPRLKRIDLLHNLMSAEEQEQLKLWLPDIQLDMSPPCNCTFDAP